MDGVLFLAGFSVDLSRDCVSFGSEVNGRYILCSVTGDALLRWGAINKSPIGLEGAFRCRESIIKDVALALFRKGKGFARGELWIRVDDVPLSLEQNSMSNSPGRARLKVLIVDDEPDCADTLAAILQLSGYEVATCYGGAEAVKEVGTFQPNTVICDLNMPFMDGFSVARTLRSQAGTGLRLIALTAYGDAENRRKSQDAGFDHHLVKPANPPVLMELLDE